MDIVYEDDYLLLVNKPDGMSTIPSHEHPTQTLANALAHHYAQTEHTGAMHFVTRLDYDTSGIVLVAKHSHIHHLFDRAQDKKEIKKENAPEARSFSPSVKGSDFVLNNKYGSYEWVELSAEEYSQLLDELGEAELARCIAYIDQSAQSTGNRNHWQDWALILRRCSREQWGVRQDKSAPKQQDETIGWHGAAYDEEECTPEEKAAAAADFERMKAYLAKLKARG